MDPTSRHPDIPWTITPGTGCRRLRDQQSDNLKPSSCLFKYVKRGRQGRTMLSPMQRRDARRIAVQLALMALTLRSCSLPRPLPMIGLGTRSRRRCRIQIAIASSTRTHLPAPTMPVSSSAAFGSHLARGRSMVPNYISDPRTLLSIRKVYPQSRRKAQIRGAGRHVPRSRTRAAALTRCVRAREEEALLRVLLGPPRRLIMLTWNPRRLFVPSRGEGASCRQAQPGQGGGARRGRDQ